MLKSDQLKLKQAGLSKALAALAALDNPDETQLADIEGKTQEFRSLGVQIEAAVIGEAAERENVKPEDREKSDLKSRARIGHFLASRLTGSPLASESAEYRDSLGLAEGIPLALFEREVRADAASTIPAANTGVNLRPVMPAVFARSVLPRLGVAMPMVGSGAYSVPTITGSLSAAAVAKGMARDSTAATITATATVPHRVSARLTIQIEDVAQFGNDTFEAALRQNLMLTLSDQLDALGLTGDNTGANPNGLLTQLTDPDNPSNVATFDAFVALAAGGIDGGPWAESMNAVRLLVNAETMRLAERSFRDREVGTGNQGRGIALGDMSAAAYLRMNTAGFFASSRMPATASDIAPAIRYRAGTIGMDGVNAVEAATCPIWSTLAIDDIYSDAANGQRHLTLHALIGDVIINYSDAYTRVDVKVS